MPRIEPLDVEELPEDLREKNENGCRPHGL